MIESILDNNLITFLILLVSVGALVGLFIGLSVFLGPKRTSKVKDSPFECGWIVTTDAWRPFPIKYYLVAILFIIFDVEVAFLYPWAVSFGNLGMAGFISMMIFLAILFVGLYYAIKKRVLDWR
ncbi:NADH-quinone oxidoreductase subunit A [bacterium]|nr:NADH-quinone oxidoreductase subunit A [bacterium]MBU1920785.1 NADH-quinone oxidoreductase subunit A [bacterium]